MFYYANGKMRTLASRRKQSGRQCRTLVPTSCRRGATSRRVEPLRCGALAMQEVRPVLQEGFPLSRQLALPLGSPDPGDWRWGSRGQFSWRVSLREKLSVPSPASGVRLACNCPFPCQGHQEKRYQSLAFWSVAFSKANDKVTNDCPELEYSAVAFYLYGGYTTLSVLSSYFSPRCPSSTLQDFHQWQFFSTHA